MSTDTSEIQLAAWWHPQGLEINQFWHCTLGPLSLFLHRQAHEWWLAWERHEELTEQAQSRSQPLTELPDELTPTRYIFDRSPLAFCLKPQLLDRALVVKTHQPVRIPASQSVTFYISSPVCVAIALQEPDIPLEVLSSLRLSDTWFGPNTREGELCYATRTHARNSREELPLRPHRAVTPVTIKNRSSQWLTVDKLSIPLPFLAVYGAPDGNLWTDPIALQHTDDSPLATLEVGRSPKGLDLLSPAREPIQRNRLVRAFTSIFSD